MNENVSDMLLLKGNIVQFLFKANEYVLIFSFYGQIETSA